MSLPIGTWSATAAGNQGNLFITAVDSAGSVDGALEIIGGTNGTISGSFNESTQQLSFITVTSATNSNISAFTYCHATLFSFKLKLGISHLLVGDEFLPFQQGVNTSGEGGTSFADLFTAN